MTRRTWTGGTGGAVDGSITTAKLADGAVTTEKLAGGIPQAYVSGLVAALALLSTGVSGSVPTTRTVTTTAPLAGGGDLSANLTLTMADFDATHSGKVPNPGGTTGRLLRDDATWAEIITRIAGATGAAGANFTLQKLTAVSADNTSQTPAVVMTTTGLGVGLWHFRYLIIYQTAQITTGVAFCVNHTGTSGQFSTRWDHTTTGVTASNGIGDGSVTSIQLVEGNSQRVKDTIGVATIGSDAADSDIQASMEGVIDVSVSGDLQLKVATEVAGSAVRVAAGTMLILTFIG